MNDGERIYKNDAFNRVTRVETTNGQVQINRYDAEGLRYEMEENKKLVQFIFNENREVVVEQSSSDIKRLIRSYDLWASECEPERHGITTPVMNREVQYLLQMKKKFVINTTMTHGAISPPVKKLSRTDFFMQDSNLIRLFNSTI